MGANAQTSVPSFADGQILTGQQQTEINTGIPVFADSSARDAAFGGTGEKTLAEGQYAYLEDTNVTQYYDGASWEPVGASGLVLISSETVGTTVASYTSQTVFSSTYDSYKITYVGGAGSTNQLLGLQLRASGVTNTANYDSAFISLQYAAGTPTDLVSSNASTWTYAGRADANNTYFNIDLNSPFLAKYSYFGGVYGADTFGIANMGRHSSATSFNQFVITPNTGTLTGGVVRVYGYQNS